MASSFFGGSQNVCSGRQGEQITALSGVDPRFRNEEGDKVGARGARFENFVN